MFVSMIKYSRSVHHILVWQWHRICLLTKPEVRDQGQKNSSVSVKVTYCRDPLKSSSCTWPNWTPKKHSMKIELFLFNHVSFGILIESLKLVFFTEGLKFVNTSNQIKCRIGGDIVVLPIHNLYRLSVPTIYVQIQFPSTNWFLRIIFMNSLSRISVINSISQIRFHELICQFVNIRKSSYEFEGLCSGSFLPNQC